MKNKLLVFFCLSWIVTWGQRPFPQASMEEFMVSGVTVHAGDGTSINNAWIWVKKGIIAGVGSMDTRPALDKNSVQMIDAPGAHVYPGFIACNTTLGLTEIEAVRATNDFTEPGSVNPDVSSCPAFYTDSKVIPTVRQNGVLISQAVPRGGLFSGTSSMMRLDAWNYEDAAITCADGIHLNWPELPNTSTSMKNEKEEWKKREQEYIKMISEISLWLARAKKYVPEKDKEPDLRLLALRKVFDGKTRLYLHADSERSIRDALYTVYSAGVSYPVLVGASEFPKCMDVVKKYGTPLMLPRIHSLPPGDDYSFDYFYKLPLIAHENKLLFCIQNQGDMEAMHCRNLPFLAGSAMAFGLPYEAAVASISGNAAKITGIDEKYGSIQKGKSATFFVSEGDALEIRSNRLTLAFIDGRPLLLENMQDKLYKTYLEKYGLGKP
jgi:imidazolonepropionase-like amidohydrolase